MNFQVNSGLTKRSQDQNSKNDSAIRLRSWSSIGGIVLLVGVLTLILLLIPGTTTGASQDADPQSTYHEFGHLNYDSVDVSSSWTKLGTTSGEHSFTKNLDATTIEVYVNSRLSVGNLEANGVQFMVRIDDDMTPDYESQGSLLQANTSDFQSIFAVFENIPAGSHTVSIWARAFPEGSASSVLVDPGGWNGRIILKETM